MAPPLEPTADEVFARRLAAETGDVLIALRRDMGDGPASGSRGDARAQDHLAQAISAAYPDDAILSEEASDSADRLRSERVWIIDPLDGTREYAEGRPDWAVHVALWRSGTLVAGAVAIPGLGEVYDTFSPLPARSVADNAIRLAVSRSRPPALATELATRLGADLVPMGSAGVKICAVVTGKVDAYVHAGGQYEWDSAAPVAVARAAGLHVSRIDGSSLLYNQEDPYMPDLLVCRAELADSILEEIADLQNLERNDAT